MIEPMRANYSVRSRAWWTELAPLAPAFVIALLGMGLVLYLTRNGAGASGDSAWYIMGAQNLLLGNGFSRFSGGGELRAITQFPPALSVALAGLSGAGMATFSAARIFNTVMFGANLLLTALLIYRASRSSWAMILGTLLVLTSSQQIEIHSWIMAEPLYIFLSLIVAHLIALGIPSSNRPLLGLAGVFVAVAILTRYAGFTLLIAGTLCILLLGQRKAKWRLGSAGLFVILGLVPFVGWVATSASDGGSIANRQVLFHSINPDLVRAYQAEVVAWVFGRQLPLPWRPRAILALLIASIGPVYFLVSRIRSGGLRRPRGDAYSEVLPWFLGSYLLAYVGVLVANSLFLDAGTPSATPARYMAPAYVALIILSTVTITELVRQVRVTKVPAILGLSLGLLLISLNLDQSIGLLGEPGLSLGYVRIRRNEPELVKALDELDPEVPIISNNPEIVFILIERPAYILPIRVDPQTQTERLDYQQNIDTQRRRLEAGAVVVIFGNPDELALEAMNDLNVSPLLGFSTAMFYKAGER
ncbi:MAG: ArnT family glycosyltransferase [Anaerolineales bacterium]